MLRSSPRADGEVRRWSQKGGGEEKCRDLRCAEWRESCDDDVVVVVLMEGEAGGERKAWSVARACCLRRKLCPEAETLVSKWCPAKHTPNSCISSSKTNFFL